MEAYIGVFAATALVTLVTTPVVRKLAIRVKAIDYPSERKIHARPTPTMGGLAMLLGVLAGMGIAWLSPALRPAFRFSSQLQGALLAGVAVAILGVIDDLRTLSAPAKVAGQIVCAGILVLNGVELLFFWVPKQGVLSLGADLAVPFRSGIGHGVVLGARGSGSPRAPGARLRQQDRGLRLIADAPSRRIRSRQ